MNNGTPDLLVLKDNGDLLMYPFIKGTFYGNDGGKKVGHGWRFTDFFVVETTR